MWKYKTGVMKNKIVLWVREMRVRWPAWVWVMAGVVLFVVVVAVAVRTAEKGWAIMPPAGVMRVAPFVLRRLPAGWPAGDARRGLEAVRAWRRWMDSLQTTPAGEVVYDSIVRARPGLLDSAKEAEAYYLQFLK